MGEDSDRHGCHARRRCQGKMGRPARRRRWLFPRWFPGRQSRCSRRDRFGSVRIRPPSLFRLLEHPVDGRSRHSLCATRRFECDQSADSIPSIGRTVTLAGAAMRIRLNALSLDKRFARIERDHGNGRQRTGEATISSSNSGGISTRVENRARIVEDQVVDRSEMQAIDALETTPVAGGWLARSNAPLPLLRYHNGSIARR